MPVIVFVWQGFFAGNHQFRHDFTQVCSCCRKGEQSSRWTQALAGGQFHRYFRWEGTASDLVEVIPVTVFVFTLCAEFLFEPFFGDILTAFGVDII
jgi:hypothetical protein